MSVECIPMDKEVGDLAPIYFKVCIINFCGLKHFPHMSVECIPMDKEVGDLAPIYFKVCSLISRPCNNTVYINKGIIALEL